MVNTRDKKRLLWPIFACGLLCIAVALAYQKMVFAYFQGDDFVILEQFFLGQQNPFHWLKSWFLSGNGVFYRPISFIVFAIDYAFWKTYAPGFHLTNILLHYGNCLLILSLVYHLTKNRSMALGASLFFAVHPVHVEAVAWISGRFDVVCAFFFFASILLYLHGYPLGTQVKKWPYALGSIASFGCALLSKEMAITLPGMLIVIDFFFRQPESAPSKRFKSVIQRWKVYIPYVLTFVIYLIIRTQALGGIGGYSNAKGSVHTQFSWEMVTYFIHKLNRLTIPLFSFTPYHALFFLIVFLIIIVMVNAPTIQFGIAWIFLTLVPVFNLYMEGEVHHLLAERFLYIPSFGFCVLLVGILKNLRKSRTLSARTHIAMASLLFLGLFAYYTYHIRSEVSLYRTASDIARTIPLEVQQKYPIVTRSSFYFENIPDNLYGAYIYRLGLSASMKMTYDLYSHENRNRRAYAYAVKSCDQMKKDGIGKTAFCFRYQNGHLVDKTDEMLFLQDSLAAPRPQTFRKDDYLISTRVEFQSPDVERFLYAGWSHAENWGRWAITDESFFLFAVAENTSYSLTMHLSAPPLQEKEQVVQVYVNAKPLGEVLLSKGEGQTVTLTIPQQHLNGHVEVLKFIPKYALSPKELGISPDTRPLSFGIQYLEFESIPE